MRNPGIAIVGAGPGGLVLARILHTRGIPATIFEREAFSNSRHQGGSLDMHADAGQFAIACAGLDNEFAKIARYEDQETRVYGKDGTLHFVDTDLSGNRPEVDRGHLRRMLLDSVPPESIRWDHALTAAEPPSDSTSTLTFRNGNRETFDFVVGADGTWSRIRPLLSPAQPEYSGITFVELGIDNVDERHPEIAKLVGRGLTFALGDSKAIIAHRDANAHIGVYAALRVPESWAEENASDLASAEADDMRNALLAHFEGWSESLLQLLHCSADQATPRGIYALPVGHRWQHRPGLTLLGDAAHVMSPFGGDGANLAMKDAAELALALAETQQGDADGDTALQLYEQAMFARAESPAAGASQAIQDVFSPNGLAHMVEQMSQYRERTEDRIEHSQPASC